MQVKYLDSIPLSSDNDVGDQCMTQRNASGSMVSVRILDQTYTLPTAATEGFRRLQAQIQLRQRLIQEGVRPKSRRWGLLPRVPAQLSMAERFHEFDLLVRDYDTIIVELQASKEAYEAFFTQLVAGVQSAVQRQERRDAPDRAGACSVAGGCAGPARYGAGAVDAPEC